MPAAYYATYTNSVGTIVVLNDENHVRFAPGQLPENIFNLPFSIVSIAVPANDPAEAYQTHLFQVRELSMVIEVRSDSPSAVATLAAALYDDLTHDAYAKARGVFTYTSDNGVTRAISCAVAEVGDLADWVNRFPMSAGSLHSIGRIPLTFRCQSPLWYDPTSDDFSSAFTGTTPINVACHNAGNADAYPRITYTGAVENPKVTDYNGHFFELDLTVAAGGVVVIDMDPLNFSAVHTPSGGPAVDVRNLQTLSSREIVVGPGVGYLTFEEDGAGTADIDIALNARYRGHGFVGAIS